MTIKLTVENALQAKEEIEKLLESVPVRLRKTIEAKGGRARV